MKNEPAHSKFCIFIVKSAAFCVLAYILAISLQKVVDTGLTKTEFCTEWDDLFNSRINADLIVQGSSRAWVHVSPRALDTALHLNSYNLGVDGHNFLMQYYRFRLYMMYNKKPKYIIQTLDSSTLSRRKDLYGIEQFYPYLDRPLMQKATSYYEGFETLDNYLPLCKYRHSNNVVLFGMLGYFVKNPKYKGFMVMDRQWDGSFDWYQKKNPDGVYEQIDSLTNRLFDEFLSYCKDNGIKVIFVYAPEYIGAQKLLLNRESIMALYKGYAAKYDIPYIDYSNDGISYDTAYFYNSQHMNRRGVQIFNDKLCADIKAVLKR